MRLFIMDLASSAIAAEGWPNKTKNNKDYSCVAGGEGETYRERIEDVPNEWAQMAQ